MSQRTRLLLPIVAVSSVIFGLALLDLIRESTVFDLTEVVLELADSAILVGAMAAVTWSVLGVRDLRETQGAMANNLARSLAKGDAWRVARQTEIDALGRAIAAQFKAWQLTPAEVDIAGLMLKGASLKEIALLRDTSEATIRQQAQQVYRKSGLCGRAELSAYFLESLFEAAEDHRLHRTGLTVIQSGG